MANELDELSGPINSAGNPIVDPQKAAAANQVSFGGSDKRTESQFPSSTGKWKQMTLPGMRNTAQFKAPATNAPSVTQAPTSSTSTPVGYNPSSNNTPPPMPPSSATPSTPEPSTEPVNPQSSTEPKESTKRSRQFKAKTINAGSEEQEDEKDESGNPKGKSKSKSLFGKEKDLHLSDLFKNTK